MTVADTQAYIIAARRTAVGRAGGLHRQRRVEELAARAIAAALDDAGLSANEVGQLVLGNASEGGNPARLVSLAAGIADTAPAFTIDRQCASGLDAILAAIRLVTAGEAEIVAAGGAESLTNAPWRLARPRSPLQPPRFFETGFGPHAADIEAAEMLAAAAGIDRVRQDAYAAEAHKASAGQAGPRLAAFGSGAAENRDEPVEFDEPPENLQPFGEDGGTLTAANTSQPGDGAAFAVVVGAAVFERLGRPPALRLLASASIGVKPGAEAAAPLEAVRQLRHRAGNPGLLRAVCCELNETSAAQAIAFRNVLGLPAGQLNSSGGMLASGRPFAAASAMLVVRLFEALQAGGSRTATIGLAATGALGGQGVAALFETVRS